MPTAHHSESESPKPPEPTSSPVLGATLAPLDLPAVRKAWRALIEEGAGATAGMGLMLRVADLSLAGEAGIALSFPPGSPAIERIAEGSRRKSIEGALSERLGRPIVLQVGAPSGHSPDAPARRITAESARDERLRRLVAEEPLLGAAVREWDLELLD